MTKLWYIRMKSPPRLAEEQVTGDRNRRKLIYNI
jgi:hypothetical protein